MIAPAVTPELAERSLIGASVHAFSVRAHTRAKPSDQTDLDFARRIPTPDELAESATVYAISLVWWAHRDLASRRELLETAVSLMLVQITDNASERPYEAGYRIYAHRLVEAALAPKVHAKEIDLRNLVSGVTEIDLMTARFADNAVNAVLLADRESFGDPTRSAETMRDEMIQLAFCPKAA
ncbi:hypothetical protein ACSMXN_02420 [Jatrophihabitans sp. DSM 45814]